MYGIDEYEKKPDQVQSKHVTWGHYYGDIVRRLFVLASFIMVVALPFLNDRLPVASTTSILGIVVISLVAGFLAPRNKWAIALNLLVSISALLVFENQAVEAYKLYSFSDPLFIVDQTLAVIFLFALYYSAKTFRSIFSSK
jgi:hypothetical protein